MNIFEVFNKGDSSIREVAYTAWLGYLLDPSEDHGLSYQFLDAFLLELDKENQSESLQAFARANINDRFVDIRLEPAFSGNKDGKGSKLDIFITLAILTKKSPFHPRQPSKDEDKVHHILIENKVNASSVIDGQLGRYAEHLEKYNGGKTLCFLTPDHERAEDKFNRETANYKFDSIWLKWKNNSNRKTDENLEPKDIVTIIQELINNEGNGTTAPLNYYLKHTLKSLIYTINHNPNFEEKTSSHDGSYSRKFEELRDDHDVVTRAEQLRAELKQHFQQAKEQFLQTFSFSEIIQNNPRFTFIRISAMQISDFEINIGLSHAKDSSVFVGIKPKDSPLSGRKKTEVRKILMQICESKDYLHLVPKNKGEYAKLESHGRAVLLDDKNTIYKRIEELCDVLVQME